jgi:DNA-binding MarR family transcriptional regulator
MSTRTKVGTGMGSDTATGATRATATDLTAATDTGAGTEPAGAVAERTWQNLRALVLERNERRKETAEALGMSFFRVKALRRISAAPSRMSELATELACDRPYLTLVVDDLEKRGLVERRLHPTDRRCKIVSATRQGHSVAARANTILGTPPPALQALPPEDLAALDRIMRALTAGG